MLLVNYHDINVTEIYKQFNIFIENFQLIFLTFEAYFLIDKVVNFSFIIELKDKN